MGSETLYYKCRTYTVHSDKCRTYKSPFGQVQNLQKPIRTSAELTKAHSDKCRTYKSPFEQVQNLQKSIRTNAELIKISKKFGQMHAPPSDDPSHGVVAPTN